MHGMHNELLLMRRHLPAHTRILCGTVQAELPRVQRNLSRLWHRAAERPLKQSMHSHAVHSSRCDPGATSPRVCTWLAYAHREASTAAHQRLAALTPGVMDTPQEFGDSLRMIQVGSPRGLPMCNPGKSCAGN